MNRFLGIRRSYINVSSRVAQDFLEGETSRPSCLPIRDSAEVLLTCLQQADPAQDSRPRFAASHEGYLPGEQRHEIEQDCAKGVFVAWSRPTHWNSGIDVGSLDATIMAGYAGTIASTWQRAGRAGRRSGSSCAVLVASSAPLDQFIVNHPDYFFGRSPERAFVQPDNLEILVNHLKCAAFELPIAVGETFGSVDVPIFAGGLRRPTFCTQYRRTLALDARKRDRRYRKLRSVTSDNFVIVDTTDATEVIGEVDFSSALATVHPKAIYLHQGQQFHVEALDFDHRKAYVKRVDVDYYTDAVRYTQVRVLESAASDRMETRGADAQAVRSHGDVLVRSG